MIRTTCLGEKIRNSSDRTFLTSCVDLALANTNGQAIAEIQLTVLFFYITIQNLRKQRV
jgi:hypothetical protein